MPAAALPAIRNDDEYEILRRYARGDDIAAIAGQDPARRERVGQIVSALCGFNRPRAAAVVAKWPKHKPLPVTAASAKTVAPARKAAPTSVVADAAPPPASDVEAAQATSNERPPRVGSSQVSDAVIVGSAATLIKEAEESKHPRAVKLAAQIREQLRQLAIILAVHEQEEELRRRITELYTEREKALEELRRLTGRLPDPSSPDGVPLSKDELAEVRIWAAKTGKPCPARSRPSRKLIAQFRAAQASGRA